MLYQTPRRPSLAALVRTAFARLGGLLAEFHRTGTDTAYIDGLGDHQLRDLGLRRFTDLDQTHYR
jgi:hypothetical protein